MGFNLGSNARGVCYNGWLTLSLTLRERGAIGVERCEPLQPKAPFKSRTKLMTTNEYTINKHYTDHIRDKKKTLIDRHCTIVCKYTPLTLHLMTDTLTYTMRCVIQIMHTLRNTYQST